jgi:hypothetical protein
MGLLDAFAMVSLRIREAKETFFEKVTGRGQGRAITRRSEAVTHSFSFQKAKAMF